AVFAILVHQRSDLTLPYQALASRESARLFSRVAPWGHKAFSSRVRSRVRSFSSDGVDSNARKTIRRNDGACQFGGPLLAEDQKPNTERRKGGEEKVSGEEKGEEKVSGPFSLDA